MPEILASLNWEDYGIAGVCLAMMFWLVRFQVTTGTRAINNNTAALTTFTDSQRELKHAIRNAPCGETLKEIQAAKRERLERE